MSSSRFLSSFVGGGQVVRSSSSFTSENVWNAWSFESQKQVFIQRAALLRPISMPPRSSHSPSRSSSRAPDYAVLVPLCVVNETPSILMTLRSSNLTRHKSEISFPGGKCERTDRDVVHTAMRESEEEILLRQDVDIWTTLPPMETRDNSAYLTAVVGNLGRLSESAVAPNPQEVEQILWNQDASISASK